MITVCGEMVADLIEQPDGTLRPVPGGSPANTALACARLGADVEFLGRFGNDVFGERARARLIDNRVGLSASVDATEPSTLAVATTDSEGHATYAFWTSGTADWQWTDDELAAAPSPGTRAVHTASVASWTPPGAQAIIAMLARAREVGCLVSYDPNIRPALVRAESPELIRAAIATAHVVKVSDEDVAALHPGTDPLESARAWLDLGPSLVVVTAGSEGARAMRPGRDDVVVPSADVTVADTIGAGDTFTAGLLTTLIDLMPAGGDPAVSLTDLTDAEVATALRAAAAAAGITVTRPGCDPPSANELAAALGAPTLAAPAWAGEVSADSS
ncbi:MAG: carbohydrate kinase [Jiangellales bacterium]